MKFLPLHFNKFIFYEHIILTVTVYQRKEKVSTIKKNRLTIQSVII